MERVIIGDTKLTAREFEIFLLVCENYEPKEICARLFLHRRTVQTTLRNVYDKLGVSGKREAIAKYREHVYIEQRNNDLVDQVNLDLARAYKERVGGEPGIAIAELHKLENKLGARLHKNDLSDAHRKKLDECLIKVLFDLSLGYKESLPIDEVGKHVKRLIRGMSHIANKYKDDSQFEGLTNYVIGDTYYVLSSKDDPTQLFKAFPMLLQAQSLIQTPDYMFYVLRTLAVISGQLRNRENLEKITISAEVLVKDFLDKEATDEDVLIIYDKICHLQEGLALGQGYASLPEALKTLELLRGHIDYMSKTNYRLPFRRIQMGRTQLEIIQRLGDKPTLQRIGSRELELADELGYPRYVQRLNELLKKSLD